MSPFSESERPVQAEAYELAMNELKQTYPTAVGDNQIIDAVMAAILDLAHAGQDNPEALARYAVGRAIRPTQGSKVKLFGYRGNDFPQSGRAQRFADVHRPLRHLIVCRSSVRGTHNQGGWRPALLDGLRRI